MVNRIVNWLLRFRPYNYGDRLLLCERDIARISRQLYRLGVKAGPEGSEEEAGPMAQDQNPTSFPAGFRHPAFPYLNQFAWGGDHADRIPSTGLPSTDQGDSISHSRKSKRPNK